MKTLRLIIILAAMAITLTIVLVFSRTVQAPAQAHIVCMLPSVENGYPEQSPVRCINPGLIASQMDIDAGVLAPPIGLAEYLHWYRTDAVLIHHAPACFVIRDMAMDHCADTLLPPTQAMYQDWHDYQSYLGGSCIYIEPDQCDGEQ